VRRAAGVDLRAKEAYAERLQAQGSVPGAAQASANMVSACTQVHSSCSQQEDQRLTCMQQYRTRSCIGARCSLAISCLARRAQHANFVWIKSILLSILQPSTVDKRRPMPTHRVC